MPDIGWPGADALGLLAEFEADPRGIGFIDIERLLDLWGVTEQLPGEDPMGYRTRVHPEDSGFWFGYPARDPLGPSTVLSICKGLRVLQQRLSGR